MLLLVGYWQLELLVDRRQLQVLLGQQLLGRLLERRRLALVVVGQHELLLGRLRERQRWRTFVAKSTLLLKMMGMIIDCPCIVHAYSYDL